MEIDVKLFARAMLNTLDDSTDQSMRLPKTVFGAIASRVFCAKVPVKDEEKEDRNGKGYGFEPASCWMR